MRQKFTVSEIIPASPEAIYDAWLDSKAHGAMTGSKAKASAKVGAKFSAWDGYIEGTNLELVPGERIVQSWRASEFSPSDADSRIAISLNAVAGGTRLTLLHTRVPEGLNDYPKGWREFYFEPMKRYFGVMATKRK